MRKIFAAFAILTLLLPLGLAQEMGIKIGHIGFGDTAQQAIFTIHNTGDAELSNVSVYVDDEFVKSLDVVLAPKRGVELVLALEPGKHTVRAEASEGVSDSVGVSIAGEIQTEKIVSTQTLLEDYQQPLAVGIILVLAALIAWVIMRRPKL